MAGPLAPWGKGLEAGLVCIPGVTAEWPPKVTVVYPKHPGGKSILQGSFVLSLWPVHVQPIALYIDPSVNSYRDGAESLVYLTMTRPIPAIVLSQDHSLACILPDGPRFVYAGVIKTCILSPVRLFSPTVLVAWMYPLAAADA